MTDIHEIYIEMIGTYIIKIFKKNNRERDL